jgi:hypothetical protein
LPALTGCLKEADRVGRGGGSISDFLGEGGCLIVAGWVGDRLPACLRGEGGVNEDADLCDKGTVVFTAGFKAPDRIRL